MTRTKEEEEALKKWIELHETGVWEVVDDEELTEGQELFIALLRGDRRDIQDKLLRYVFSSEYLLCHDGGEPSMEHILAVKLLECMGIGSRVAMSIIYQEAYLEHIFKKGNGDAKG